MYEQYHTFWRRVGASIIDFVVLIPLNLVSFVVVFGAVRDEDYGRAMVVSAASVFVGLAYRIVMHALWGATVGKRSTSVQVVDAVTGGKISWAQAIRRESISIVSGLAPVAIAAFAGTEESVRGEANTLTQWASAAWGIAEIISVATTEKRRALHDFIAGTVVIKTNWVAPIQAYPDYVTNPYAQTGYPQYPPPPTMDKPKGW